MTQDARQYIMRSAAGSYDLVIGDAYTSGSTIPPHLMTAEFYQEIADCMTPSGILLSNIIGSYKHKKHLVLGGAMRSMQAGGLPEIHNFPIMMAREELKNAFEEHTARNNIVLASKQPLDPQRNAQGWERLTSFTPYSDLPTDTYVTRFVQLVDHRTSNYTDLVFHS